MQRSINQHPDNPKLTQLIEEIKSLQKPFLALLNITFGTDLVCGAASQALGNILSKKLQLPLGIALPGDHVEIKIGTYRNPQEIDKTEEHTYIKIHLGDLIIFVDAVWNALHGKPKSIILQPYHPSEFETGISQDFFIQPFDADDKRIQEFIQASSKEIAQEIHDVMLKAFNEPNVRAVFEQSSEGGIISHPRWREIKTLVEFFTGKVSTVVNVSGRLSFFTPKNAVPRQVYEDQPVTTAYHGSERGEHDTIILHLQGNRFLMKGNGTAVALRNGFKRDMTEEEIARLIKLIQESDNPKAKKILESFMKVNPIIQKKE